MYEVESRGDLAREIPDDLDRFLERMSELAGETRRRTAPPPRLPVTPAAAHDKRGQSRPKVELILYTSPESGRSQRAVRAIEEVLQSYDRSQVRVTMCDLSSRPEEGEADSIVFTPTLVKQGPGPRTSIIGNLEDKDILRDLLDSSGVDRRWDD